MPDLSVAVSNGVLQVAEGEGIAYVARMENIGTESTAAVLTTSHSSTLVDVEWICVAVSGQAACPSGQGIGAPSAQVWMQPGDRLEWHLAASVEGLAGEFAEFEMQVHPAAGAPDDANAGNDASSDRDTIVPWHLFKDGYEERE